MRKQKIKSHFFSLRADDYFKLRDAGLTNAAVNILKHNPAKFFRDFAKYTREVADEHKSELYYLCFQIATDRDRNRIESLIYEKKSKSRKEVKVA